MTLNNLDTQEGDTAYRTFTTNPGLEKVARGEFRQRCYAANAPRGSHDASVTAVRGRISTYAPAAIMADLEQRMRSVHHVLRPLHQFHLGVEDGTQRIAEEVGTLHIPEMQDAASFRISSHRHGNHTFSSQQVMAAAGAAINAHWGTPVNLKNFAVELRVDVVDDLCTVNLARTQQSLSNRHARTQSHPAALRANIAYAALRLAQLDGAERLLDPFCGSGTILLEAAEVWPQLELVGCDSHEQAATGAQTNLAAAGWAGRAQVLNRNSLDGLEDLGTFDAVVANPPFGRRLNRAMDFPSFYRRLFEAMKPLLRPGARLIFLADRNGAVNHGLRAAGGFQLRRQRLLQMGGVWPSINVFERTESRP